MSIYYVDVAPDGTARYYVDKQEVEFNIYQQTQANDTMEQERLAIAQRQTELTQPLMPLPIEGSTVDEIKASAETAISDLATQMQAKIDAILGGV